MNSVGVKAGTTAPTVSWYYKGALQTATTTTSASATLVTGSALVLNCVARGTNTAGAESAFGGEAPGNTPPRLFTSPAFAITKGSAGTITANAATAITSGNAAGNTLAFTGQGTSFTLTVTGGTRVWDSVNGNGADFDYFLAIPNFTRTIGGPSSGTVQMYLAALSTKDAGSYYCLFYDGSGQPAGLLNLATGPAITMTDRVGASNPFTLAVTTVSTGSGTSRNTPTTKSIQYSLALLGASTMFF